MMEGETLQGDCGPEALSVKDLRSPSLNYGVVV